MVLAVGARPIGHASSATLTSSTTSAARARVDAVSPVSAISGSSMRLMSGSRRTISSVSPLLDSASDDVALHEDAGVAVRRFGGVQEQCGRAGARERRGDLAADESRLAHAGDHHLAAARARADRKRPVEARVEAVGECRDRGGLDGQHAARLAHVLALARRGAPPAAA